MLLTLISWSVSSILGTPELAEVIERLLPEAQIERFVQDDDASQLYLRAPDVRLRLLTELDLEQLSRELLPRVYPTQPQRGRIRSLEIWARSDDSAYVPLASYLPPVPPVPKKPYETPPTLPTGHSGDAPGRTPGALSGKTVYLSQGHGFFWSDAGAWKAQRPNTHNIVEDLVNAEAINTYLVAYLENAGARVFTVRERDMTTTMTIVDNGEPGYEETGAVDRFSAGNAAFGRPPAVMTESVAPFSLGTERLLAVDATPVAAARWVPSVGVAGTFTVYVTYTQAPTRATDAHYRVLHTGGATDIRVDQSQHGGTWLSLGRFHFAAGTDGASGAVELWNDSAGGSEVSVDAVRFGGGMGDIDRGGGTSRRPRWEEAARYYTQYNGAPSTVYDPWTSGDGSDDVNARSRYAAWEHPDGEDAVYISWHTNAPSPARGTSSYVYGPNAPDGTYDFAGTAGSDALVTFIHNELIDDFRADWEAGWQDRGIFTAWFGEINPAHNGEMPACLIEVAFHDTLADADAIREPQFRQLTARAMTQGIIKYFADRDGLAPVLPPEPPTHLVVRGVGPGAVVVSWRPPAAGEPDGDAAVAYRVYRSRDGFGFDNGRSVTESYLDISGLEAGPIWVRVTAVNAGGESFPTETLGALPGEETAAVLIVNGFDRVDGASLIREDLSAFGLGTEVDRMFMDRINNFSYAVTHGRAVAALGVTFDAASNEAVRDGDPSLEGYRAVDWITGEEASVDEALSADEQTVLGAFLESGGNALLSGSEAAWDLGWLGTTEDKIFMAVFFGAVYGADDSMVYTVEAVPGTFADGLSSFTFDDGHGGIYDVDFPDVLEPVGPGRAILAYPGVEGAAGIAVDAGYRTVFLGFPFETVLEPEARTELMAAVLGYFFDAPIELSDGGPAEGGPLDDGVGPEGDTSVPGDVAGGDNDIVPPDGCGCASQGGATIWPLLLFFPSTIVRRRARRLKKSGRE